MSPAEKEEFYHNLFKHHVLNGATYRETAQMLNVNYHTIVDHMKRDKKDGFLAWMKTRHPERFDRDYMVARFMDRSEERRTTAMVELTKDGLTPRDRARMLKEMREEDETQVQLLQDIGVIEREADADLNMPIIFQFGEETPVQAAKIPVKTPAKRKR